MPGPEITRTSSHYTTTSHSSALPSFVAQVRMGQAGMLNGIAGWVESGLLSPQQAGPLLQDQALISHALSAFTKDGAISPQEAQFLQMMNLQAQMNLMNALMSPNFGNLFGGMGGMGAAHGGMIRQLANGIASGVVNDDLAAAMLGQMGQSMAHSWGENMLGGGMFGGGMYGGSMYGGSMYGDMFGGSMYGGSMYGGSMYGGSMYGF